jgi:hypothetical protein
MTTARLAWILLGVSAVGLAQNYRCDWSVVGIGGGEVRSRTRKLPQR